MDQQVSDQPTAALQRRHARLRAELESLERARTSIELTLAAPGGPQTRPVPLYPLRGPDGWFWLSDPVVVVSFGGDTRYARAIALDRETLTDEAKRNFMIADLPYHPGRYLALLAEDTQKQADAVFRGNAPDRIGWATDSNQPGFSANGDKRYCAKPVSADFEGSLEDRRRELRELEEEIERSRWEGEGGNPAPAPDEPPSFEQNEEQVTGEQLDGPQNLAGVLGGAMFDAPAPDLAPISLEIKRLAGADGSLRLRWQADHVSGVVDLFSWAQAELANRRSETPVEYTYTAYQVEGEPPVPVFEDEFRGRITLARLARGRVEDFENMLLALVA